MENNTPNINVPSQVTAPIMPNTPLRVPIGIKVIAALFYIASVVFIFLGIMLAFVSSVSLQALGSLGLSAGLVPGLASVAWGALNFFAGRGLWSGQQWGRILAITINGLYIIFGVIGIIMLGGTSYISLVINIAIILYLLFGKNISAVFQNANSIGTSAVLALIAFAVYTTMVYPTYFATSTISPSDYNRLMQNNSTGSKITPTPQNPSNSQVTPTAVPTITPSPTATQINSSSNTQIYNNATYKFQINIPKGDSTNDSSPKPPYESYVFNNPSGVADFGIDVKSIDMSVDNLQTLTDSRLKFEPSPVEKTNIQMAGEPAINATEVLANGVTLNWYFVVHKGYFYILSRGKNISSQEFDALATSLAFLN